MSSKFPDENGETGEETMYKKRARRVSFAETTAVHFFNRDEECETTPDDSKEKDQNSGKPQLSRTESDEIMELLQSSSSSSSSSSSNGGGGGGSDDDDDVDCVLKCSFLRPVESPSSGSCFGSATSNDENNFFGPVSADFIRRERLSDSAVSDEYHEVTMDSTTFSMNFRSLARSESGGDCRTPTGVRLPFGVRTHGQTSTEASVGDLMVLTEARKHITDSACPITKVISSAGSDDMSLVGDTHLKYDYGQLPPELDVLLREGKNDVDAMSHTRDTECSNSKSDMSTELGQLPLELDVLLGEGKNDAEAMSFTHDTECSNSKSDMSPELGQLPPDRYDYGQLPPEFDVLLGDGDNDAVTTSNAGNIECSNTKSAVSPGQGQELSGHKSSDLIDNRDTGSCHKNGFVKTSDEGISVNLLVEGKNDAEAMSFTRDTECSNSKSDMRPELGQLLPDRYDYGQLPAELNVLLGDGNNDAVATSDPGDIECSNTRSAVWPTQGQEFSGRKSYDLIDTRDAGSFHKNDFGNSSSEPISANFLNAEKGSDGISDAALGETNGYHSDQVDHVPGPSTPSSDPIKASFLQIQDIPLEKDSNSRIGSEVAGMLESPQSSTRSKLHHEPPIPGSISSLQSKRRQIFKDPYASENNLLNSPQVNKEFRVKGTLSHAWSTSVFTKSVSRLKRLETSFLSASKVQGNTSRLGAHRFSPTFLEKDNNVAYVDKDISFTRLDAPVACLDVRFAESDGQFERESERDSYHLKNTGILKRESCIKVDKDEKSAKQCKSSPSQKNSATHLIFSSPPASLDTGLVNCKPNNSHESELETRAIKTPQSMRYESSLLDMTFSDLKDRTNTVMLGDSACLPGSGVVNKVPASPLYKKSPSVLNVDHQVQKETDGLASAVENQTSLLIAEKFKLKLSSSDIDHVFGNSPKPDLKDTVLKSRTTIISNNDIENGRILTSSTRDLPVQRMQSIPVSTLSSDARSNEPPVQVLDKPKEEPVCSMVLKETCDSRADAKVNLSEGQDNATLDKLMTKYNEDVQHLQASSDTSASDGPLSHKRKLSDEIQDHNDHALLLPRKAKLSKYQKTSEEGHNASHYTKSDLAARDWADVLTSFCEAIRQPLIPTSDKFNVDLIAKLEDILVHLDKLKSYELLQHEKSMDSAHLCHNKKVADTKILLYKTMYQKARLQLLCLKRDKLLDQACKMKSRVDESEKLVSSCGLIRKRGEIDQIGCLRLEHHCADTDKQSSASAEISSLRKELEVSEGKIRTINKSFNSRIKDKQELTSIETASYAKGVLKKMVACQSLQSEFQLYKVERLHAINGRPNITFNHGGFMLQSFTTESTATSGLLLVNRLNKEEICKMFINDMDAHTAFSFVLSGDTRLTYEGLRTIAEQTQKTVSLLHVLLDVIEEVQLEMIKLKTLTRARFCQPSAGKLDLQLCFTDFRSGARVTLTIDITCLNRGVYPSQVLPYEVQGVTPHNPDIFESRLADIRTSVQGVRSGFMRIRSICQCVSRMIETNGMT